MSAFIIESQAPTRIDLAGGTIDIWPLYLFHESAVTINLAVNLYAKTRIKLRMDSKIIIESKDLKKGIKFDSIKDIKHNHPLSLITRAINERGWLCLISFIESNFIPFFKSFDSIIIFESIRSLILVFA